MAEDVPARDTEGVSQRRNVTGIVFDARRSRRGRSLARATSSLVIEHELPAGGERSQRRPQHDVAVDQSAVHAEERWPAGDCGRKKHRELQPARTDPVGYQTRRTRLALLEFGESLLRG